MTNAIDILVAASQAIENRAPTRDEGDQKSIMLAVAVFAVLTGIKLTERQGWQFMACVKLARAEQGKFEPDDYVDLAGYVALIGEAAAGEGSS